MVTIIPAILATTEEQFTEELAHLKKAPSLAEGWVHIDFMDGELVETKSIALDLLEKFDIPFKKEAHLMVKEPKKWLNELKKQGFERVFIHAESEDIESTLASIKELGMEVGLAVNPETDLVDLKSYLNNISALQIMSVNPGKQGQPFLSSTYDKVIEAKEMFEVIQVDGGVDIETAPRLVDAGASRLVMGSYLQKGDAEEDVEKIWEALG